MMTWTLCEPDHVGWCTVKSASQLCVVVTTTVQVCGRPYLAPSTHSWIAVGWSLCERSTVPVACRVRVPPLTTEGAAGEVMATVGSGLAAVTATVASLL